MKSTDCDDNERPPGRPRIHHDPDPILAYRIRLMRVSGLKLKTVLQQAGITKERFYAHYYVSAYPDMDRQALKHRVVTLRNAGYRLKEIAAQVGVTISTAHRMIKASNL